MGRDSVQIEEWVDINGSRSLEVFPLTLHLTPTPQSFRTSRREPSSCSTLSFSQAQPPLRGPNEFRQAQPGGWLLLQDAPLTRSLTLFLSLPTVQSASSFTTVHTTFLYLSIYLSLSTSLFSLQNPTRLRCQVSRGSHLFDVVYAP